MAAVAAVAFFLSGGRVLRRLRGDLEVASRLLAQTQASVSDLEAESASLKDELKQRISDCDAMRVERSHWEGQSLLARQENERLGKELEGMRASVEALEAEVEKRVREVVALEARLSDPNTSPDALQARIGALEDQIVSLESNLSDARFVIHGLLRVRPLSGPEGARAEGRVLCRIVGRDQGRGYVVLEGQGSPAWQVASSLDLMRDGKVIAKARVALVDSRLCVAELDPEFRKFALVDEGEYVEIAL
ncbi:MAG TPA: hypothetical protein PKX94_08210 [Opitutales bacterium]|mgnify:CR=1 FL=1|nr:hypothetical protein [Opitutales bacterium]